MYSIILAWGWWTRLQPLSTEEKPKQFLPLINEKSLLQNTVERILQIDPDPQHIFISTWNDYREQSLKQLAGYKVDRLITEPERRNTGPAIAYIIKYLEDIEKAKSDSVILVCPSDHHITPTQKFSQYIKEAEKYAHEWKIVLFGIKPDMPETNYGYIQVVDTNWSALPIQQFVEKPNIEKAQEYLAAGNYFWNAGIFMFRLDAMKEEFKNFCPEIYSHMQLPFDEFVSTFSELPKISIDYALMEKTKKSTLIPMDLQRSDLGSRDALWKYGAKDNNGNLIIWDKKITYPNILI